MQNIHLQRRIDNAKEKTESVINELIDELESRDKEIGILADRVDELEAENEEAANIQDTFAQFIVNKLNSKQ